MILSFCDDTASKGKLFRIQMQYFGIRMKLRNHDYRSEPEMKEHKSDRTACFTYFIQRKFLSKWMSMNDELETTWKLVPVGYIYLLSNQFQERTELNHKKPVGTVGPAPSI